MRLFIAIELPDPVKNMLATMHSDMPGARWVTPVQMHLTIAFAGEVDDGTCKLLAKELATIKAPAFKLRFDTPGCFPDRHRPRVLWIGLEPEPLLINLAKLIQRALRVCAVAQEGRPFSPHVTLARFKDPPGSSALRTYLEQHANPHLPDVAVDEFILFESRLTYAGATHIPLEHFPLRKAGAPGLTSRGI